MLPCCILGFSLRSNQYNLPSFSLFSKYSLLMVIMPNLAVIFLKHQLLGMSHEGFLSCRVSLSGWRQGRIHNICSHSFSLITCVLSVSFYTCFSSFRPTSHPFSSLPHPLSFTSSFSSPVVTSNHGYQSTSTLMTHHSLITNSFIGLQRLGYIRGLWDSTLSLYFISPAVFNDVAESCVIASVRVILHIFQWHKFLTGSSINFHLNLWKKSTLYG